EIGQSCDGGRAPPVHLPSPDPDRPYHQARRLQADAGRPGARDWVEAEVRTATIMFACPGHGAARRPSVPSPLAGQGRGGGCHKHTISLGYPPPCPSPARGEGTLRRPLSTGPSILARRTVRAPC